ncbi:hypothetical protein BX600DRAFT_434535 [Xylariales sp. PMI_506]|nr:hypothetical protein BX600DRAFT_434535 [Xylariales sp. PMI_506]
MEMPILRQCEKVSVTRTIHTSQDGAWLAADGIYQDHINALCGSDPRLRHRDPKSDTQKTPWEDADARVVVLELEDNDRFGDAVQFVNPNKLDAYLSYDEIHDRAAENTIASSWPRRRVMILEGLNPNFISVLGEHFSLHPSLFIEHERVVVMNRKGLGENDGMPLPSVAGRRDHMVMKYFEPTVFSEPPSGFRLVCGSTGRHIGVSREYGEFSEVGIVRRKCSVWTRESKDGSWDCLILSDPRITKVRTGYEYKEVYEVITQPYQGGYIDFVPYGQSMIAPGPPRTSLLDDIVYYLQRHSALVDLSRPETSVAVFLRKIIASHYVKHLGHVRATLSYVQRGLSRKQDLTRLKMEQVEELWSDMQAWERRMGEYCEDLEAIMLQLGMPLEPAAGTSGGRPASADWADSTLDFQYLRMSFRELRHRTEGLNSAITGLASIAGNRQAFREQQLAVREAKSTKAVTLLGLVFIPLAYTSSLFSMSDPFRPGDDGFWIYFAASIPLILVVMGGYYVLDWGYRDDGGAWSPQTFWKTFKAKMRPKKRAEPGGNSSIGMEGTGAG